MAYFAVADHGSSLLRRMVCISAAICVALFSSADGTRQASDVLGTRYSADGWVSGDIS